MFHVIFRLNHQLWHERLGRLNEQYLKTLGKSKKIKGMSSFNGQSLPLCEICVKGKHAQNSFPEGKSDRTSEILEIVHSDVCGPFHVESLGGKRCFATFIDDYSRWCEVVVLRQKSDLLDEFKNHVQKVENRSGKRVKCLQSDNGKEYVNKEFDAFLRLKGITRRLTVPHTPQQNGIAERKNRTLLEATRCLLLQRSMSPGFWAEAVTTACYLQNRHPSSAIDFQIPFELWFGKEMIICLYPLVHHV